MLLGETTPEILELGTTEDKILQVIKNNPKVTGRELAAIIGVTEDGIKYQLAKLKKLGIIKHEGFTKAGGWIVLK